MSTQEFVLCRGIVTRDLVQGRCSGRGRQTATSSTSGVVLLDFILKQKFPRLLVSNHKSFHFPFEEIESLRGRRDSTRKGVATETKVGQRRSNVEGLSCSNFNFSS
jgi:hypothetical protein